MIRYLNIFSLTIFIAQFSWFPEHSFGNDGPSDTSEVAQNILPSKESSFSSDSIYSLRENFHVPRSFVFPQLASFLLPGFDQYWEGQTDSALAYSGLATAAIIFGSSFSDEIRDIEDSAGFETLTKEEQESILTHSEPHRKASLSNSLYMASGSFSAYHAFRTAVRSQKPYGKFQFLTKEESAKDLLLAPFQFSYLKRPSTYIPLGIISGIFLLTSNSEIENYEKKSITSSDAFYGSSFSYLAGTHEEALFRGWVMPSFRESTGSDLWSNLITSTIFAMAHLNTVSRPIPQLVLGWHLGNVSQKNNWTLSESIFIHTWWDVLAFINVYQFRYKKDNNVSQLPLMLPPLKFVF